MEATVDTFGPFGCGNVLWAEFLASDGSKGEKVVLLVFSRGSSNPSVFAGRGCDFRRVPGILHNPYPSPDYSRERLFGFFRAGKSFVSEYYFRGPVFGEFGNQLQARLWVAFTVVGFSGARYLVTMLSKVLWEKNQLLSSGPIRS